jgi:hypothetical protein
VGGGLFIWWLDWLIECFDFIFSLCNFLKWVMCQLMNDGQKCGVFCKDRTAAALFPQTSTENQIKHKPNETGHTISTTHLPEHKINTAHLPQQTLHVGSHDIMSSSDII